MNRSVVANHSFKTTVSALSGIEALYNKWILRQSSSPVKSALKISLLLAFCVFLIGVFLENFGFWLGLSGVGYFIIVLFYSSVFSGESKILLKIFLALNPGIFLVLGGGSLVNLYPPIPPFHWSWWYYLITSLIGAMAGGYVASAFIRRKALLHSEELAYVLSIPKTIAAELGEKQQIELSLNPFGRELGGIPFKFSGKAREGRTITCFDDLHCEIRIPFEGSYITKVEIRTRSFEKVKNRKQKYKGTKLVIFYSFEIKNLSDKPFGVLKIDDIETMIRNTVANNQIRIKLKQSQNKYSLILVQKSMATKRGKFEPELYLAPENIWSVAGILTKGLV